MTDLLFELMLTIQFLWNVLAHKNRTGKATNHPILTNTDLFRGLSIKNPKNLKKELYLAFSRGASVSNINY